MQVVQGLHLLERVYQILDAGDAEAVVSEQQLHLLHIFQGLETCGQALEAHIADFALSQVKVDFLQG